MIALQTEQTNFPIWLSKENVINLRPSKILEAAEMGHIQDVKNLLQRGIDVNFTCQNVLQMTSLHYASKNNHIEIVELLLQSGAD